VPVEDGVAEVGRGVGDDRHRAPGRVAEGLVLRPHVVGLAEGDRAPLAGPGEHGLGRVGVDVDLQDVAHLGHHHRAAEAVHGAAHLVRRRQGLAPHHQLGAELVVALGGHRGEGGRRQFDGDGARVGRRGEDRVAIDQPDHPFDHADEALAARVHHAGLAKRGEQLGGAGQGHFALAEHPAHELAHVGGVEGGPLGSLGRAPGHGQDGAFARLVEGAVQPVVALPDGPGHLGSGGHLAVADRLGEAQEEMGEHHARVAPGPEHGGPGHGLGCLAEGRVAQRMEGVGDGAEGQAEIRPGVPVGDREHVEAVELVAAGGYPVGRRVHGAGQTRPVHVRDADAHPGPIPAPPRR
jgi:hypothetical protein